MSAVTDRIFQALMPKSAARTNHALEAISALKKAAEDRRREQEAIIEIACSGKACELAKSLHDLSRKLAS